MDCSNKARYLRQNIQINVALGEKKSALATNSPTQSTLAYPLPCPGNTYNDNPIEPVGFLCLLLFHAREKSKLISG